MRYERSVFTIFDLLGNIGGLFDALSAIAQLFLLAISTLTSTGYHSYIMHKLFKKSNSSRTDQGKPETVE